MRLFALLALGLFAGACQAPDPVGVESRSQAAPGMSEPAGSEAAGSEADGSEADGSEPDGSEAGAEPWRSREVAGYRLAFLPEPAPIPLNEPFELLVRVERLQGSGERALDPGEARLDVTAWMPDHAHGMLRRPRVDAVGPGHWRVRGMLFHMSGAWELGLELRIPAERLSANARFEVELP